MIFEMPKIFEDLEYYVGIPLICWIIVIVLYFYSTFLFLRRAIKEKKKKDISYLAFTGYGIFTLCMGLTRIFFLLGVHFPEFYDFYTILGYISGISGLIYWLYIVETHMVKKTKKIFTILSVITFSFSLIALLGFADRYLALNIQYVLLPISLGAIVILYIYLIIKTTGTVRKKVIWILIGLLLIAIAQILDGEAFITAFPEFPFIIAPLIMMIGIILFLLTQLYYRG